MPAHKFDFRGLPKNIAEALKLVYAGAQCLDDGDLSGAESNWRRAVQLHPECSLAWARLSDLLALDNRLAEAVRCLDPLIASTPKSAENLIELAGKCVHLKEYDRARRVLREALRLKLSSAMRSKADVLLATADFFEENWDAALERVNQILSREPDNLDAVAIQQKCFLCLYHASEDVAACRRYIKLKPDAVMHGRLLFKMNFLAETSPEGLYEESKRWSDLHAAPLESEIVRHTNTRDPNRRLRIGYVSPDFRQHAIMKLLPVVIERHDKSRFEVFAYCIATQEDHMTRYARSWLKNFVALPLSGSEIAKRVQADQIDILVDLAGHTLNADAFLAFALKPAPVQVTWMGALATTGLSTMDYFLGDGIMPCPGTEHLFSETVYRLGRTHCCYRPTADVPLAPPPYFANGFITFGCFNGPHKITREMVKVWSEILHLHPGSKLILKSKNLQREAVQRRLREWFTSNGVNASRLEFEGSSGSNEYLASWNKVDIALDPFPYNGGTTTMDAFWMGIPVVSLSGRLAVSTCGATLLSAVGLPVASTIEQYISIAGQFAKAIPNQPDMREQLREAMRKSALMDEPGLINALENAYREMWRKWCNQDWESDLEAANQILESDPGNLDALILRQKYWHNVSYVPEAVADCRLALSVKPDVRMHDRLLFQLNYLPETTQEALYEESIRWNALYAEPLRSKIIPHTNTLDPDRKLKIGYFSADFRDHAIMKLLPAVFDGHDEKQFQIFAYSVNTQEDHVTRYVRSCVGNFVELPLSKDEIAGRVRADGIDILVDLSGHTLQSDAYLAFALKPAPIQVSWMGALATTGLSTMDYFIGDALMPCPGTEHLFSEKVYRLGRVHCCYRPDGDGGVYSPPYFSNGYITFGCFNGPKKITRDVVKVWSVILHLHPGSKLMLKFLNLDREITQRRLRAWFTEDGISGDRLSFEGSSGCVEYFAAWNKVDIALDPFPYTGGTTTMDALWMGVPVVSLAGRLAVARCGATLLSSVGLPFANTPEEYISLAARWAQGIPHSPEVRRQLRATMLKSPLMDEGGMVRALEDAYRNMWRAWCASWR